MTDPTLARKIASLEHRLHLSSIRANPKELEQLLANDFLEYGASGMIYGKFEIIQSLEANPTLELEIENEYVKELAPGVCLITYTSVKTIGNETLRTNRSSIWRQNDNHWQMVFHQGTKVDNHQSNLKSENDQ